MRILFACSMLWSVCLWSGGAGAATKHLYAGGDFERAVESLQPGDTLIVHKGTYAGSGRISIKVKGTARQPVVVMGAQGEPKPLITRPSGASAQNTINIEGATYLTIKGLEIRSNGGDGINLNSQPSYITLEDLHIHNIDVGVNFRSNMHHITVRRCRIHDTAGTGEGMYVGCNDNTCRVWDSLFEGNWIYNTKAASQGDGIEIKKGSYNNIVRHNVIYNTKYPCILLYGTEGKARNIVEGNVMWGCGDSGIQVAADAIIRNNIILNSPANGLNSQPHQNVTPKNLRVVHNTIVGGNPCLRFSSWANAAGMVFANNAVYCASGNFKLQSLAGVTIRGNVFTPKPPTVFPAAGYKVGKAASQDLQDAANRDVYPRAASSLIDAGHAGHVVAVDFNGTARTGTPEAGAYTYTQGSNPGWKPKAGFKPLTQSQPPQEPTPEPTGPEPPRPEPPGQEPTRPEPALEPTRPEPPAPDTGIGSEAGAAQEQQNDAGAALDRDLTNDAPTQEAPPFEASGGQDRGVSGQEGPGQPDASRPSERSTAGEQAGVGQDGEAFQPKGCGCQSASSNGGGLWWLLLFWCAILCLRRSAARPYGDHG